MDKKPKKPKKDKKISLWREKRDHGEKKEEIVEPRTRSQTSESNQHSNSNNEATELQSEIDMLGNLDIDQIDNILSIADNMAVKLAY